MAGRGRGRGLRPTTLDLPSPGIGIGTGIDERVPRGRGRGISLIVAIGAGEFSPSPPSAVVAPLVIAETRTGTTPAFERNYKGLKFIPVMTTELPEGSGYFVQGFGNSTSGIIAVEEFEQGSKAPVSPTDHIDLEDPNSHPIQMPTIQPLIQPVQLDQIVAPDNFFIKPSGRVASPFSLLKSKLNYWYNGNKSALPRLRLEDLVSGGHYVAFSEPEGTWHRVMVKSWNPDGSVSVQLCDDGGFKVVPVNNIRQIRRSFCDLPMQALHASLQMVEGDAWTPEEVALFKKQVAGREFCSVIIKNRFDPEFAPFQTVEIILLDVTPDGQTTYNFGGRLSFGYSFGTLTPGN